MNDSKKIDKRSIKNIKSSYIIKKIFSFIDKMKKLDIIIYNKHFQNVIGVNIEDYKKASGKYKVILENGKGKEYNISNDKLIFEGEYLNKKRNGKGKEYYENGLLTCLHLGDGDYPFP